MYGSAGLSALYYLSCLGVWYHIYYYLSECTTIHNAHLGFLSLHTLRWYRTDNVTNISYNYKHSLFLLSIPYQ